MNAEPLVAAVALAATIGSGAACNAMYGPTAPDRNWNVHETPRFSLYVRPGSFCESAATSLGEVLEEQYTHATRTLGLATQVRLSVFLYNSGAEVHPPLPSERSGVAFPDTQAVHAVCVAPLD